MIAHGALCGLLNYWENNIVVPTNPVTSAPTATTTPVPDAAATETTTLLLQTHLSTPLHSLSLTFLEYQLHESIALSSILINLVDISGTSIDPRGKYHEAWTLLKEQYGKLSKRTRNMRECDLDECRYVEGTKVADDGGHIERMQNLRKLANDAGASYNDKRFKTKLINSFSESWDTICSICYNIASLSEVISTLTSHGERVLQTKNVTSSMDTIKALEASVLALQA
jgi:hypothetical protein